MVAPEWVERVRSEMGELPRVMAARFVADYGVPEYDATTLTQSKAMAAYFEAVAKASGQPKLASNWIMGELSRRVNEDGCDFSTLPISPMRLGAALKMIAENKLFKAGLIQVIDHFWRDAQFAGGYGDTLEQAEQVVTTIMKLKGLDETTDSSALEKIIDEVIAANADNVAQFKAGKDKAFNALVGQAMKASKGKANPAQVNELLKKKLAG